MKITITIEDIDNDQVDFKMEFDPELKKDENIESPALGFASDFFEYARAKQKEQNNPR